MFNIVCYNDKDTNIKKCHDLLGTVLSQDCSKCFLCINTFNPHNNPVISNFIAISLMRKQKQIGLHKML